MSVLEWGKPPKAMTTDEWKSISADSAPPGVYTPSMDRDWQERWKARLIGVKAGDPRVEVRKTVTGPRSYAQLLLVVRRGSVTLSANGKVMFDMETFRELGQAVSEARERLLRDTEGEVKVEVLRPSHSLSFADIGVRVTHIPTGTVAECVTERSQMANKAKALEELWDKLDKERSRE